MSDFQSTPDAQSLTALLGELPANLLAGRRVLVTGAARGLGPVSYTHLTLPTKA